MQGFNMGRYVPPDAEGVLSGNQLIKRHALGHRASKLSQGILKVRFEMPFPIWCSSCPRPTVIGQGVRFNAEKKKVGSYHSSPIWSFRFSHADCGGVIEMRTDPKNHDFDVVEGARRRDTGENIVREGDVEILTEEERERLRQNAFAGLEKTIEDRDRLASSAKRVADLEDVSARHWEDPYARNQALRKTFRAERKRLEKEAGIAEELKGRMGLEIDLLPASASDELRATLVDFGPKHDAESAFTKPLFPSALKSDGVVKRDDAKEKGRTKAEVLAAKRKEGLVSRIISNTRKAQDPFLVESTGSALKFAKITGVKRKLASPELPERAEAKKGVIERRDALAGLVDYDSE
jgi:coiled-coil domain-containing protein 130